MQENTNEFMRPFLGQEDSPVEDYKRFLEEKFGVKDINKKQIETIMKISSLFSDCNEIIDKTAADAMQTGAPSEDLDEDMNELVSAELFHGRISLSRKITAEDFQEFVWISTEYFLGCVSKNPEPKPPLITLETVMWLWDCFNLVQKKIALFKSYHRCVFRTIGMLVHKADVTFSGTELKARYLLDTHECIYANHPKFCKRCGRHEYDNEMDVCALTIDDIDESLKLFVEKQAIGDFGNDTYEMY